MKLPGVLSESSLRGNIPTLAISANHAFDLKYQVIDINLQGNNVSFPAIYPYTQATLGAYWTVFDGFKTINSYSAAKLTSEAAHLEFSRTALTVEDEVRLKFYEALAADQLAEVPEQNVKTLEDHLNSVKTLLGHGNATRFELLRVQVQLEEAVPEKLSAVDNGITARRALASAMGMETDERPLKGSLPEYKSTDVVQKLVWGENDRADLTALRRRAEAADKVYEASLSTFLPKVSFAAERQYYNNDSPALGDPYKDAYSIGVQLQWNLFDGGASIARQQEMIYQRTQAEAATTEARLKAPNEFDAWKRKFLYSTVLFSAKKRAIEAAEESVRLAKVGVQAGTRTHTDLLDAELDLFRARAGAVRAQLESAEAYINLELALGRRFE